MYETLANSSGSWPPGGVYRPGPEGDGLLLWLNEALKARIKAKPMANKLSVLK